MDPLERAELLRIREAFSASLSNKRYAYVYTRSKKGITEIELLVPGGSTRQVLAVLARAKPTLSVFVKEVPQVE
jgi:hypothetical protein